MVSYKVYGEGLNGRQESASPGDLALIHLDRLYGKPVISVPPIPGVAEDRPAAASPGIDAGSLHQIDAVLHQIDVFVGRTIVKING